MPEGEFNLEKKKKTCKKHIIHWFLIQKSFLIRKSMVAFTMLVLMDISSNFLSWRSTYTTWESPSSKTLISMSRMTFTRAIL